MYNPHLGGSQYRMAIRLSFLVCVCRQQGRVIVGNRRTEIYICILTCGETYVRHVVWDTLIVERIIYTMCDGGETSSKGSVDVSSDEVELPASRRLSSIVRKMIRLPCAAPI